MITREAKVKMLEEVTEELKQADLIVVTNYRGLNVQAISKLRGELRKENCRYKVTKNSMNRLACRQAGLEELEEDEDELFPDAVQLVVDSGQASISILQRRLRIGYTRAARLIDDMEARGIVGTFEGSKAREVLITPEQLHDVLKKKKSDDGR